jgi:aminopeptidase-like protein
LAGSLAVYLAVVRILENNACYFNLNTKCEPLLGKRWLYRTLGRLADAGQIELAMLWVLNLSDGSQSLLDIAERYGLGFGLIHQAANALFEARLLNCLGERNEAKAWSEHEHNFL